MNVLATFAAQSYIGSQRLRTNLSGIDASDIGHIKVPDALSGFPDVVNRFAQQRRNGRPLTTAPMPLGLKVLNQRMWPGQDWKAIQLMEQRRWDWGKEQFDGTRFEYVGVKGQTGLLPYKRQPLLRSSMRGGFMPNRQDTTSDERAAMEAPLFPPSAGVPATIDTRKFRPHLDNVLELEEDREIS